MPITATTSAQPLAKRSGWWLRQRLKRSGRPRVDTTIQRENSVRPPFQPRGSPAGPTPAAPTTAAAPAADRSRTGCRTQTTPPDRPARCWQSARCAGCARTRARPRAALARRVARPCARTPGWRAARGAGGLAPSGPVLCGTGSVGKAMQRMVFAQLLFEPALMSAGATRWRAHEPRVCREPCRMRAGPVVRSPTTAAGAQPAGAYICASGMPAARSSAFKAVISAPRSWSRRSSTCGSSRASASGSTPPNGPGALCSSR